MAENYREFNPGNDQESRGHKTEDLKMNGKILSAG